MRKTLLLFLGIFFFLNSYGQAWMQVGAGANSTVNDLIVYNNELIAGGGFNNVGMGIAKWNGTSWANFGYGVDSGGAVICFDTLNSNLYAAGLFSSMDSVAANNIAMWNGATWIPLAAGVNGRIICMAFYSGDLYVGGQFSMAGSTPVNNIAKWDGSNWSDVGAGVAGTIIPHVHSLCVYNNELYAGGSFTSPGNNIAKWDGNNWSTLGGGVNDQVNALTVFNNELYVGGYFVNVNSTPCDGIAKWIGSWSVVNPNFNELPLTMSVINGNLFVAGGGAPDSSLKVMSGAIWNPIHTGIPSPTSAFIVHGIYAVEKYGNDIYLGGMFYQGWNEPGDCIIYTNQSVGIGELSNNFNAELFPNPSNGNFQVNGNFPANSEIHFYDLLGNEIHLAVRPQIDNQRINLQLNLPDGLYFYKIFSNNKTIASGKFVISK
ncbi:hypothetical protein BH09BAC5_BH09BAC5_26850 [soil metagenome]